MQISSLKIPTAMWKLVAANPMSRFLAPDEYATAPYDRVLDVSTLSTIKTIKSIFNNKLFIIYQPFLSFYFSLNFIL